MLIPARLVRSALRSLYFVLDIEQLETRTRLHMRLHSPEVVNTYYLPSTVSILNARLPKILSSTCFNDDNLPFSEEVKATEIGHLFEHVLLEYLCAEKLALGSHGATYRGTTSWNWQKEPRGVFHIAVSAGKKDIIIFEEALRKTTMLIEYVMASGQYLNTSVTSGAKSSALTQSTSV